MLGHGIEHIPRHIDTDSEWRHPNGRYKSEFIKKIRDKVKYQVEKKVHPKTPESI